MFLTSTQTICQIVYYLRVKKAVTIKQNCTAEQHIYNNPPEKPKKHKTPPAPYFSKANPCKTDKKKPPSNNSPNPYKKHSPKWDS
jgi:hypothetical protein